jgi:transposase
MFTPASALVTDENQLKRLRFLTRSGKTPQKVALRARIVLLAADGVANNAIARRLATSRPTVLLWRGRFSSLGVAGIMKDAKRPGRKKAISPEVVQKVVEKTLHSTPRGATHWSTRSMAKEMGISHLSVHRIWKQHGLAPHRVETFKMSKDLKFVEKLRDVVGLYLDPPDKALVLSVDEKSQIQALERTRPLLPLRPGIPARQTHDYSRHGTTTLYAALSMLDGKVIGECLPRHRSEEFLHFLRRIDRETPADRALHLIVDNSSTHKSPPVKQWLLRHKRFHLHFTPTSSSWLNMVERWFGEISQKRIRRGSFQSVKELIAAIEEYLDQYNLAPKRFVWTKDADMILSKVARCKEALVTGH